MPEALSTQPEPYRHHWKPGGKYDDLTGWAIRRRTTPSGASWSTSGSGTASSSTAGRRSRAGAGRSGTSRTSATGTARRRSTRSSTTTPPTALKRALPTARVGGPDVDRAHGARPQRFLRGFLEHCLRGTNYATGKVGTPLDFVAFHAKGAPRVRRRPRADGRRQPAPRHRQRLPDRRVVPRAAGHADRHRRIRPRGLRRLPGATYPQNGYRNGTMYSSYTAEQLARTYELADRHGVT